MKKLLALILAVAMITVLFAGCGNKKPQATAEGDLGYILEKGTLVVGITDFEPMDYQENGEWVGFDAELAKAFGEKLGVEVKFQEINWATKETELAAKTIDCIWNGLTWDEERAANMSLSDYYMVNRQVVVTRRDSAEAYASIDALRSSTMAAESGSAGEAFIKENFSHATYIEKDGQKDVLTELLAETVDAGVIDYIMANYLINKSGSDFSALTILDGSVTAENEYYSVAFRKDSNVTEKFNSILKELKKDGTVETIAKKYGLADALVK